MYEPKSLLGFRAGIACASLIALGVVACDNPQPPTSCGPLPQVTVNAGESTTVTACFNDPNGDMLSYSATSSNPGVATASISGTSVTVRAVAPGNASVTVTAADPEGLQGQQSFQVMVPNRPPQPRGTIPSVSVPAGELATVDASSYFTEPDGEALTYGATSSNPAVATVTVAGSRVTVTAVAKGTSNVTVTATDPGGLTATQTFQFTVPNRDPETVGTIPDQTVEVDETTTVDLTSFFEDPDGDPLTYAVASSRSAVARGSVSGSTLTVSAVAPGTATLTVTARDNDGASATQRFKVTVPQPNRAPRRVGTIPAQTLAPGGRTTIDASRYFSDPDGDALRYTATSSNSGVARASVSGSTVTITAVVTGSATITVTARDPEGLTAAQPAQVTVSQSNRAPRRVGTIPAQTINPGGTATVDASRYFSDPDSDALTYTATSSNSGVARASVSGSRVTITAVATGGATITVTARDPAGLSATQQTRVTVRSDSDYQPLSALTITSAGGVRFANFNIGTGCLTINRVTINGVRYEIHWTEWQRKTAGSDWAQVPGTRKNGQICGYDLSGAAAGEYRLVGEMSVNGARGRYRSANTVTVSGGGEAPDLVFTGVSPTTVTVSPGDTVRATFTIRNSGSAASAATTVRGFVSDNSTISTSDDELSGTLSLRALDASEEFQVRFSLSLSSNIGSGTFYAGLCVDPVAGESDTTNNCSQSVRVRITSSGAPDLVFTGVSPRTQTVPRGDTVRATFAIRNNGTVASTATTVRVFASDNSTISTSDTELFDASLPAYPANAEDSLRVSWTVSPTAPLITIYWGLCVDPVAGESDTSNNCSESVRLTITAASSQSATSVASAGRADALLRSLAGSRIESQGAVIDPGQEDATSLNQLLAGAIILLEEVKR